MAFRPMQNFQIIGGPGWLNTERFDIEAKSGTVLTPKASDLAIRAILEDRFQLRTHQESRELPMFELVVAKDGPKLKRVNLTDRPRDATVSVEGRPQASGSLPPGAVSSGRGRLNASAITIVQLATALSAIAGRPIVDKTGLDGSFEVNLQYTSEVRNVETSRLTEPVPGRSPSTPSETDVSLFTAIQEQLGLRLVSTKGPADVIVIDKIERPTEN